MGRLTLTAVAVCLLISVAEPQGFTILTENSRINVTVGGNALFPVKPSAAVNSGNWDFRGKTVGQWIGTTVGFNTEYKTRAEIFPANGSLLLKSVTASDSGDYTVSMNPVNGSTATKTIALHVLDGPDLPNISIDPDLSNYPPGRTVTFSCSVVSNPPAELEWYLNDTSLQQKGQQLIISNITLNGTGNYTCQALNNLTKRYAASTKQIVVIEPVSNVSVSSNNSKPVENVDTVSLTCNAMGSIQSRIWYKDKQVIKHNDRIITSLDNVTLTLINVNRHDSGTYKCNARNDFSIESGDFKLQVNYGPENVSIAPSGPVEVEQGQSLTLTCTAVSVPPATYEWYNGSQLLKAGETYSIEPINSNSGGNYTCRVNNNITEISKNTTVQVTVQGKHKMESKLSTGAKVGIALAVLGCVVILVVVTVLCMKKKCKIFRAKGGSQQNNITVASPGKGPVPPSNGTNIEATKPREPDVVYAQPNILQQGAKTSAATTENIKTDYAELKFK
ncbi:cell adhesion molecule CEACAM5-like isoform X3 [Cetorhinus maximus]